MILCIRKNSRYKGHPVLLTERMHVGRSGTRGPVQYFRGYMIAGATGGEIVLSGRSVTVVNPLVWMLALVLMGARYEESSK